MPTASITWLSSGQKSTTLVDAANLISSANADPDLTATDKVVLSVLVFRHYNFKTKRLNPSINRLAQGAGIGRRAAFTSIAHLRGLGYIGVTSGSAEGRPNQFKIHWAIRRGEGCTTVHPQGCTLVHPNIVKNNMRSAYRKESCRESSGGAE